MMRASGWRAQRWICPLVTLFVAASALAACSNEAAVDEAFANDGAPSPATSVERLEIASRQFTIERRLDSMDGPYGIAEVEIPATRDGELVWLTAVRNRAIDTATGDALSQEFLCHSNLSWPAEGQMGRATAAFSGTDSLDLRIMTLIQGQNEIELPSGFGFPLVAGEPLEFMTMVINKNVDEVPFDLQVRTELEYVRDGDLAEPVVPLFKRRLFNFVKIDTPSDDMSGQHEGGGHEAMGHDMGSGMAAPSALANATLGRGEDGETYGMHWVVPPGRHEYRNAVDSQLGLPFDTTVHYATAHLHPFGESIELIDTTSGETIFRLEAHEYTDRVGIAEMDSFSNVSGIELARDRTYELVTVYDNTTDQPVDAMAILFLYLRDQAFERVTS